MQQLIQNYNSVSLLSTIFFFILPAKKIFMLLVMQISDYLVVFGCSCTCEKIAVAVLICVMWVQGQYFHLRADRTLSFALWTCLEMHRMLLAILSFVIWHSETFSLEEKLEVTCKCYFQCEGLQFVVLPHLCALKKQFSTSSCSSFFFFPSPSNTMFGPSI